MTKKNQKQQVDIENATPANPAEGLAPLLGTLRQLIADSRQQVLRAADVVQVQTYWHVGRHIVEFEQGGTQRASYGQRWKTKVSRAAGRPGCFPCPPEGPGPGGAPQGAGFIASVGDLQGIPNRP
ncbi:DUF1016 N-terminal domain-containing protein [Methylococcus sp. EFPC2]|uniref:DUF1016 N-terminal domain-containing protein n=1 Tax=Methylococcus sp. EFPC2 TaxID=2812648 RepID=UPI00196890E4|nr:DUF1016 N-terminal domain-containing protein [Methylococcus sp. EFPC2]QSA97533.1 hypothetical protein JWZ97_01410 [Methylococcus sp. EFPC2]